MGFIITAGVFGGKYADDFFGFGFPVLTVILSLLSVVVAIYIVIKDLLK
jgi:hypothetical protein